MSIDSLVKQANKKYGTNIMAKGSSIVEMPRIPTGSLSLDVETGGGIPVGRISTFSGHFSDGKTSIVLKIVAEYQKKFPEKEVVWIDAEGAWDDNWSRTLGVDADNVYLIHPEYSQQAFDLAEQCITEDVGLLVIDSIAALVPKEEAEATMEDWQIGLAARINNKFVRRTHSSLNDKRGNDVPPTVILINQLRQNVGGYGAAETEPGGKGIGFAASIRIKIRRGDLYPKAKSNYDQTVVPKAQEIKFFIEKNKTAPPQTRGHVWFYFDSLDQFRPKGCYDRLEEIIRYAKKYDIITQRGPMFDLPDPDTGEANSFKGSSALAEHIRGSLKVQLWIEKEVMRRVQSGYLDQKIDKKIVEMEEEIAKEKQELGKPNGNNETTGNKSSERNGSKESTSKRSNSVGKGGLVKSESSDTTQVYDEGESFHLHGIAGDG